MSKNEEVRIKVHLLLMISKKKFINYRRTHSPFFQVSLTIKGIISGFEIKRKKNLLDEIHIFATVMST